MPEEQRTKRQNNFTDYLPLYGPSWKPHSVRSNYMSLARTELLDTLRVMITFWIVSQLGMRRAGGHQWGKSCPTSPWSYMSVCVYEGLEWQIKTSLLWKQVYTLKSLHLPGS